MNNTQLEQLLRQARPPARPEGYWPAFSKRVMARIEREPHSRKEEHATGSPRFWLRPAFAWISLGAAALAVAIGLAFLAGTPQTVAVSESRLAAMRHCASEVRALFPNQVRAIHFDSAGAQVVLASRAEIRESPALYLKICSAKECREIITFSGNQFLIDGEPCEMLVSGSGAVVLLGRNIFWSSTKPAKAAGRYRIAARSLEAT